MPLRSTIHQILRPLVRFLPDTIRDRLRRIWWKHIASPNHASTPPIKRTAVAAPSLSGAPGDAPESSSYAHRLATEQDIFSAQEEINDLPDIFHYWSNTYLRPKLETFGCSNPDQFFANALQSATADAPGRTARFVSLGAGNCDTEVRVAKILVDRGIENFVIECLDINRDTLARGIQHARSAGVEAQISALRGDFNDWQPVGQYDALMANQSLHHVMNLEGLFAAVERAMQPHARFVISDMIGRNGHQRWPEALAHVQEFWKELPESYRYNVQLRRHEREFLDWDCSVAGFEGIRAQDILPLLLARFDFEMFLGFANIVDPFIDRSFGPHFNADSATDRALIDRIHARDEAEIASGRIKPTHMMAILRPRPFDQAVRCPDGLTPAFCERPTEPVAN